MLHFPVENNLSSMQLQCHFCFGIMLIIIFVMYTASKWVARLLVHMSISGLTRKTCCPSIAVCLLCYWSYSYKLGSLLNQDNYAISLYCLWLLAACVITSWSWSKCWHPPTHHWTGRLLPIYVCDQHSFQPLRVIP